MCSYLFHQRCIQNCYVSLQCLKSTLDVSFCFWHLKRERKKNKFSRLMIQCYLLCILYLTYMYHYHVQVFFTCSPDTLRGIFFLNLICLFVFFSSRCGYSITVYFSSWSNFWKNKSISIWMEYIIHFISFLFLIYPRVCRMAKLISPEALCIFWPSLPY